MIYVLIILIVGGLVFTWSRFIGTKGLIIKEYAYQNIKIPEEFNGKKIVHFADLHFGSTIKKEELTNVIDRINLLKPDICIFTGDLVDKNYELGDGEKDLLIKELSRIESVIGKYSVKGNHDYDHDYYDEIITSSGFISIDNDYRLIYYKGTEPIVISGVTSMLKTDIDLDKAFAYKNDDTTKDLFSIFLAHEPDTLTRARSFNIDLMLSGHSHGGQVRLPYVGSIYTPKGSKTYYEEHYKVDETDLYISGGIGTSTLKIRLFNKPSINLFRLYKN